MDEYDRGHADGAAGKDSDGTPDTLIREGVHKGAYKNLYDDGYMDGRAEYIEGASG